MRLVFFNGLLRVLARLKIRWMSLSIANFQTSHFSRRDFVLCALLTAALWYFSLRESGLFALGWIAPLPLFYALSFVDDAKTRRRRAYLAGWFCYALLNAWIFPTILRGGSAISVSPPVAALLGVVAVVLIGAIHGVQLWLVGWIFDANSRLAQRAVWLLPLGAAALWTAFDILRTSGPLAHGWGALAFSQWRDYALLQNAAFIGQHGLTFLCVWCAASLALWVRRGDAVLWRAPLAVFLTLHLFGAWRLAFAAQATQKLRVLLIQTNASSADKSRGDVAVPFNRALALTQQNARAGQFDLVVWPETTFEVRGLDAPRFAELRDDTKNFATARVSAPPRVLSSPRFAAAREYSQKAKAALPIGFAKNEAPVAAQLMDFPAAKKRDALPSGAEPQQSDDAPPASPDSRADLHGDAVVQFPREGEGGAQLRAIVETARRLKTRFLCGALLYTRDGHLFNAAVLVDEAGRVQVSAKERLVPFGERAPFGEILPLLRRFSPPSEIEVGRSVVMNLPPGDARYSAASTRSTAQANDVKSASGAENVSPRDRALNLTRRDDAAMTPYFSRPTSPPGGARNRFENRARSINASTRGASTFQQVALRKDDAQFVATTENVALTENDAAADASTRGVKFGALICFESCFVSPAAQLRSDGAQALFVLTNDQWFSGTGAPWQHAAMAAMRAAENGVAVAQAGNGGYSFCVDRQGRFVIKSSLDTESAVAVSVPVGR